MFGARVCGYARECGWWLQLPRLAGVAVGCVGDAALGGCFIVARCFNCERVGGRGSGDVLVSAVWLAGRWWWVGLTGWVAGGGRCACFDGC